MTDTGQIHACEDCGWMPPERHFVQPSHEARGRWVCKRCHFAAENRHPMTAANEYRGLAQLEPPLRHVPWERKRSMMRLREVSGMEPHEFRECDETRMVPDFFAVMDGEFWVLEIEGTYPVKPERILAWAKLADYVGHLVKLRLFVHVTRLNVTTEPSLPDALMEWYASRVPAAK